MIIVKLNYQHHLEEGLEGPAPLGPAVHDCADVICHQGEVRRARETGWRERWVVRGCWCWTVERYSFPGG